MRIYSPQANWNKVIEWGVECLKGKSLKASTCKLAWGYVYHLWIQRKAKFMDGIFKVRCGC